MTRLFNIDIVHFEQKSLAKLEKIRPFFFCFHNYKIHITKLQEFTIILNESFIYLEIYF